MTWQQRTVIRILMVVAQLITPSEWRDEVKGLAVHLSVHIPEKKEA